MPARSVLREIETTWISQREGHTGLCEAESAAVADEERTKGLHVDELVARLPDGKKVEPQKLARCLRLLSAEHWYVLS